MLLHAATAATLVGCSRARDAQRYVARHEGKTNLRPLGITSSCDYAYWRLLPREVKSKLRLAIENLIGRI
jgi:hypothetical protein